MTVCPLCGAQADVGLFAVYCPNEQCQNADPEAVAEVADTVEFEMPELHPWLAYYGDDDPRECPECGARVTSGASEPAPRYPAE